MRWVLWLALASCGGTIAPVEAVVDASDASSADAAPSCGRLETSSCVTASSLTSCTTGNLISMCLGDAGDTCDVSDASCTSECDAGEYAARCGEPNPTSSSAPPSTACRDVLLTPGNVAYYCCPCE